MKTRILTLILLLFLDAACAFAQADRHEVRRGNRLFGKENWKEAELSYRKALVKDSLSVAGRYNLASALYRQENYEGAREVMQSFEGQQMSSDQSYNAGDIALQLKDYAGAVEAFRNSLLLNPGDLDAKENYIYAKKMLENQQQQQQGGGQDRQDQDGQDDEESQDKNDDGGQQPQDRPQDQPDGFARLPVIEGKRLFPRHMEQQVALADAAPQNRLDGVHTAGVVLRNAYQLLILRKMNVQQLDGI